MQSCLYTVGGSKAVRNAPAIGREEEELVSELVPASLEPGCSNFFLTRAKKTSNLTKRHRPKVRNTFCIVKMQDGTRIPSSVLD